MGPIVSEMVRAVFDTVETMFPGTVYVMIIEEGLLLAPDCLSYTAALLPLLHDPTVLAVSAWNPNGETEKFCDYNRLQ